MFLILQSSFFLINKLKRIILFFYNIFIIFLLILHKTQLFNVNAYFFYIFLSTKKTESEITLTPAFCSFTASAIIKIVFFNFIEFFNLLFTNFNNFIHFQFHLTSSLDYGWPSKQQHMLLHRQLLE